MLPENQPDLINLMHVWFGDNPHIGAATFLNGKGYLVTPNNQFLKPVPSHTMSREETLCVLFLSHFHGFEGVCYED